MKKKELEFILQEGEGLKIEFKENLNNVEKEMVAFANAEGGRIFLGVSDDNRIKGIKITNKLKSQIQDTTNNCDPPVKISLEEFNNILIIDAEEGEDKPYKCKDGFFMRIGPNSQKMGRDKILEIAVGEGKIKFDETLNKEFDFNKDLDIGKLNNFLKKADITKAIKNEDVLINLGVAKRVKDKTLCNNTGVLFFAKEPCDIIRQAYVTCVRFKGTDNVDIIDRIDLKEDIITNIENAINFVRRNTRLSYEIKDIKRKEIPEYPVEAVREAITNAVMHRDYFEKGANVFVNIFDDRLEVYNPGGLPKGLNKKDFGRKVVRRNPLIADLLHRVGYVEKAGTGILRMQRIMEERGLPKPKIDITSFFTVTFYQSAERVGEKVGERVGEKVGEKLTENQSKIINFILKNPSISAIELSNLVGISSRKVEENISKLKKKGLIKRIGPAKGGYWKVTR